MGIAHVQGSAFGVGDSRGSGLGRPKLHRTRRALKPENPEPENRTAPNSEPRARPRTRPRNPTPNPEPGTLPSTANPEPDWDERTRKLEGCQRTGCSRLM